MMYNDIDQFSFITPLTISVINERVARFLYGLRLI